MTAMSLWLKVDHGNVFISEESEHSSLHFPIKDYMTLYIFAYIR